MNTLVEPKECIKYSWGSYVWMKEDIDVEVICLEAIMNNQCNNGYCVVSWCNSVLQNDGKFIILGKRWPNICIIILSILCNSKFII